MQLFSRFPLTSSSASVETLTEYVELNQRVVISHRNKLRSEFTEQSLVYPIQLNWELNWEGMIN